MPRAGAALAAAWLVCAAGSLEAQASGESTDGALAVRVERCGRLFDEGVFRRTLGAELRAGGANGAAATRLRVRCAGRAASLRAATSGRRGLDRRLDLGEVPQDAAARLAALSAAELVVASRAAPFVGPGEADAEGDGSTARGARPDEGPEEPTRDRPVEPRSAGSAWSVGVGGQWLFRESSPFVGLRAAWAAPIHGLLAWGVSAEAFLTPADVDPGTLFVLPATATLELRIQGGVGGGVLYGALGVRGGVAWFSGRPADTAQTRGRRFVAPTGAALVAFGARFRDARPAPGIRVEASHLVFPAEARLDETSVYELGGLAVSAFVDLSF